MPIWKGYPLPELPDGYEWKSKGPAFPASAVDGRTAESLEREEVSKRVDKVIEDLGANKIGKGQVDRLGDAVDKAKPLANSDAAVGGIFGKRNLFGCFAGTCHDCGRFWAVTDDEKPQCLDCGGQLQAPHTRAEWDKWRLGWRAAERGSLRAGGQDVWDQTQEQRNACTHTVDGMYPPDPVSPRPIVDAAPAPDPTGKEPIDWSAINRSFA